MVGSFNTGEAVRDRGRSSWIAALFGAIMPGLGHIYIGRPFRGICVFIVFFCVNILSALWSFGLFPHFWVIAVLLIAACATFVFAVADPAIKARAASKKNYNRWYVYAGSYFAGVCLVAGLFPAMSAAISNPQSAYHAAFTEMMEPTIRRGERFISDTRYYHDHAVKRGDVVIFSRPTQKGAVTVRRIGALPGERVSLRNGHVVVNGAPLSEPYAQFGEKVVTIQTESKVPDGQVFVIGDNRGQSNNSDGGIAIVPIGALSARATEIVFSRDPARLGHWVGTPTTP